METLKVETIVELRIIYKSDSAFCLKTSFKVEEPITFDKSSELQMDGKVYNLYSIENKILPEFSLLKRIYIFYNVEE